MVIGSIGRYPKGMRFRRNSNFLHCRVCGADRRGGCYECPGAVAHRAALQTISLAMTIGCCRVWLFPGPFVGGNNTVQHRFLCWVDRGGLGVGVEPNDKLEWVHSTCFSSPGCPLVMKISCLLSAD